MIDDDSKQEQQATLKKNYKKIENYVFSYQQKLGSGSFSEVFRGFDVRDNSPVAVKVIKIQSITSKITLTFLQQEINILKQLNHQNIIHCFNVFNSLNNCYIITEFCKYGDLDKLLKLKKKFTQPQLSSYLYYIYKGLLYLSEIGVIHRDFKIANIFLNQSGIPKIADFGFAIKSRQLIKDISLGSPIYMTPQAIFNKQYSPKTDIWAFGVLIYELISGKAPLSGVTTKQQLKQKVVLPPPLLKQCISPQLRNLIQRCLTVSVKNRISMQQISNHVYIRRISQQFEVNKIQTEMESMSETQNSSKSSKLVYLAMQNPISYEQAVSVLQYCRLLSKVCQCLKSPILQQWLLKMIYDLNKTKLKEDEMVDYTKYKQTVSNYCNRYFDEFKDRGIKVRIDDVLKQCQQYLVKDKKHQPQIIAIGTQTNILREALFHPLKLVYFAKKSNAAKYMS